MVVESSLPSLGILSFANIPTNAANFGRVVDSIIADRTADFFDRSADFFNERADEVDGQPALRVPVGHVLLDR